MRKQRMLQLRGKPYCRFGRIVLGCDGTYKPDHSQRHQQAAHAKHIGHFSAADPSVDDGRHHKRYKQFKGSLQHFKKRGQNRLFLIVFQINKQFFHDATTFLAL